MCLCVSKKAPVGSHRRIATFAFLVGFFSSREERKGPPRRLTTVRQAYLLKTVASFFRSGNNLWQNCLKTIRHIVHTEKNLCKLCACVV